MNNAVVDGSEALGQVVPGELSLAVLPILCCTSSMLPPLSQVENSPWSTGSSNLQVEYKSLTTII